VINPVAATPQLWVPLLGESEEQCLESHTPEYCEAQAATEPKDIPTQFEAAFYDVVGALILIVSVVLVVRAIRRFMQP